MRIIISALFFTLSFVAVADIVQYEVDGKSYEGFYTSPSADAPLILLLHDWDGLTEYELQRTQMLAQKGYAVFAADLFGAGIRPTEDKDKRQHTGELYQDREKMRALMNGALQKAAELGAKIDNAVVMGYCFGGAAVLEMARSGADLKGFVSFHGGLRTPDGQDYAATKGEILILHGAADHHISMDEFAHLGEELEQQGVTYEMIAYGGARHAFTVFGGDRYQAEADRKSWQRFLYFLENKLH
ncbi:dienelactone hydrolase family protein [Methylophaga sp. OBS4]|uniref:dienelactone hydrolase family protein n=1 Tax=Methylophaga sp. OBS4 TaxID=2991935 RepID=UPI00224E5B5D|nr:dienelactone hydrolase family protein [Methylophaga sp. OBS4]MCX4186547.1 dienelactone hydrolase family protein [Methylophaga sp. OBS4]